MKNLEKTIKLLNYIHENPQSTQRELVEKIDVSLGKVNFIINALVEKGLIKLERFKSSKNKAGYLYLLTSKGMREKAEITKRFLEDKLAEYERMKGEIERLKQEIGTQADSEEKDN